MGRKEFMQNVANVLRKLPQYDGLTEIDTAIENGTEYVLLYYPDIVHAVNITGMSNTAVLMQAVTAKENTRGAVNEWRR